MADETNYPRFRDDELSMLTLDNVQGYEQGRPDVLYMKGYRGEQLETEYKKMLDELEVTPEYWLHYNNLFNGVVSEVTVGKSVVIPQLNDSLTWLTKYDTNIR